MKAIFHLLATLVFVHLAINLAFAEDEYSDAQQQLDQISEIVAEIELKLQKDEKDQRVINKQMAELEQEIGHLHRQISSTKEQISASQKRLKDLQAQTEALNKQVNLQSDQFKHQIRLAYVANSQSKWKVLLSQKNLQHIGRNAVIYDYIHEARVTQISDLQDLATKSLKNKIAQQAEHKKLQNLLKIYTNSQNNLANVRNDKHAIQVALAQRIAGGNALLTEEKAKQAKLKKLITSLKVKQAKGKFTQQKGKLSWPLVGDLKYEFGDARQRASGTKWNGALITASKGTEIRAIYPGTVVFSDWFDRYGWLIIIDHGDDYMSLYAHAEGLYKSVDDEVSQGELIAVVGDSGDINQAGLYFEIRRQGTPVDPASWCITPNMAYSP